MLDLPFESLTRWIAGMLERQKAKSTLMADDWKITREIGDASLSLALHWTGLAFEFPFSILSLVIRSFEVDWGSRRLIAVSSIRVGKC